MIDYSQALYSSKQAAPFPHWVQPFEQLATALDGRDAAVAHVELGSKVSSFMEYENQANPLGRLEFLGRIFNLI